MLIRIVVFLSLVIGVSECLYEGSESQCEEGVESDDGYSVFVPRARSWATSERKKLTRPASTVEGLKEKYSFKLQTFGRSNYSFKHSE